MERGGQQDELVPHDGGTCCVRRCACSGVGICGRYFPHQSISAAPFVSRSGQPMVKSCRSAAAVPGDNLGSYSGLFISGVRRDSTWSCDLRRPKSDADPLSLHRRHSRDPKIALAPLMVIWMGYGISSKVLMAFLFAFFPVVITTLGGLAGTPVHLVEHFRANRASQWTMFRRLQLPSALPSIMDGCKTAMPLAVIGAIVGEFVGSDKGLGYLILEANASARSDLLFAALVVVSVVAGALYWLVELIAGRVWWRAL